MFISKILLVAVTAAAAFPLLARAEIKPIITPAKEPVTTPAPLIRAGLSPVSIRVEQPTKTDNEKDKKTAKRSLKIYVSNSSTEPLELKVKYVLFGRNAGTGDIQSVDDGERPGSVKPRATEIVETTVATAIVVESKFDKGKRTPASGMKFVGYGVQVFIGDKMVAEAYDPPAMKESWGKVVAAPKAK